MKAFLRKHPALSITAVFVMVVIGLDKIGAHAFAIVIALIWLVTVADAWDEDTGNG